CRGYLMIYAAPGTQSSPFKGPDAPSEDDLYKCVHCGFCLQACPTYIQTGLETESPRGRIALMKATNEGRLQLTETVVNHWDLCIQCRACETACPSGVPYGKLIEGTMAQVRHKKTQRLVKRIISNLLLKWLLPHQNRLGVLISLLRLYQRFGVENLVRKTKILRIFSKTIVELEQSMPRLTGSYFKARGQVIPATGEKRARVALLSGCVMPLVHGPQMESVVRVLTRNGCEIVVSSGQTCCGAINTHAGDLETARKMARRNIDVFNADDVDAVVNASAGCGTRMKEYPHLLKNDPGYSKKAKQFSLKVKDIHEFLVELPFIPPTGKLNQLITYQDSCHLSHSQSITEAPRIILRSIPGLELSEMENSTNCCGAGGTYAITQHEMSLRLLDSKMEDATGTGAETIATANPGCVIQLQYGTRRTGLNADVRYVV
ncbi:MAG: (Fe-S)-binding protein, partial [SAR202 cluster bacterium]|nr:(Fe-S)-binding protein [SAR202 cluster bacterium]